jgi:phosphatidylserine/phosphatidylglycerophosphate/cardiolipin synthase-like enzyme
MVAGFLAAATRGALSETLRFIPEGSDAWETRVEMIRTARASIDVAMFIWQADASGLRIARELQAAARRGVRVRIVADAIARALPQRVLAALSQGNRLHIHDYRPPDIRRIGWINTRMHDKMLIVDGQRLLVGGRNFTNHYYDRGKDWNYIDLDVLATGGPAREAAAYFEELWASGDTRDVPAPPRIKPLNQGRFVARTDSHDAALRRHGQSMLDDAPPLPPSLRPQPRRTLSASPSSVEFVHEDLPREAASARCISAVEDLLAAARSEVWITTPWLVTTVRTDALLRACLARGVKVRVVTNSLNACRDYLVFAEHVRTCEDLSRAGASIWWMPGRDSLHSKCIVVDGRVAVAGTLNLDPRSEYWNTECMVVARDAAAARDLLEVIRLQSRGAFPFDPGKPRFMGVDDPPLSVRVQRAFLPVSRWFSPLIRKFL